MVMPGRKYPAAGGLYRFGFNGKENDNDVKGDGNQQDYGMRIYDPRLMRFLSVDPISAKYPELSTFQFASNSPIKFIDFDGLERMNPAAKQPTGITVLSNATIPIGGIIDQNHFIKAGNYRLHGVTNGEGKQWWIARKPEAGGYSDDFIVGTDAVFGFIKLAGKAEWIAYWNHKAEANGGGLFGGFKAAWSAQNVAAGLVIGLGGLVSLGQTSTFPKRTPAKNMEQIFVAGEEVKASELVEFSKNQGWSKVQTENGPLQYVDENNIVRLNIKKGSARTPGSEEPHVEVRNATGDRINPATGEKVSKRSKENHTKIKYDL